MTIEELFGTLQQSVVSGWRKHLRSAKYGKHEALDEFYKEMPEKVDALIEAWMGAHGKKIGSYSNILQSSNMNTLKYLGELKKVCKDGYDLLDDNEELESLLDDIVNLINSTLYKVKELSESNMKSLTDLLMESLVNESSTEYGFAWNHFNPQTMYCIEGDMKKFTDFIQDYDWNYDTANIKTKLCTVIWNDEMMYTSSVKGNNLNDAKLHELKSLTQQLQARQADDYVYLSSDIFGGDGEWSDEDVSFDPQEYVDRFLSMVENSEVDGDSSYARSLIDIKKKTVLLGPEVIFMNLDEFVEMMRGGED